MNEFFRLNELGKIKYPNFQQVTLGYADIVVLAWTLKCISLKVSSLITFLSISID